MDPEDGSRCTGAYAHWLHGQNDEMSKHARPGVQGRECETSDQALEHHAGLTEAGQVHEEIEQSGVDEHRCRKPPPLAVRCARPEVASPSDKRFRVVEGAGSEEHAHEDRRIRAQEHRRHDHPVRSRAKCGPERLAFREGARHGVVCGSDAGQNGLSESSAFLGCRHAIDNPEHNQENKDGPHAPDSVKICARAACGLSGDCEPSRDPRRCGISGLDAEPRVCNRAGRRLAVCRLRAYDKWFMKRLACTALFLCVLMRGAPVSAHPAPFSYLDVVLGGDSVNVTLVVHSYDLAHDLKMETAERLLDPAFVRGRAQSLQALVQSRFHIQVDGRAVACEASNPVEVLADRQSLKFRSRASPVARAC